MRRAVSEMTPCRGGAQAAWVVREADGLAESPQETRVRLLLRRGGPPAPVGQYRVFDDAGFVARVDSAHPELRPAIEDDGSWHGARPASMDTVVGSTG